jgi:hypothetical protein
MRLGTLRRGIRQRDDILSLVADTPIIGCYVGTQPDQLRPLSAQWNRVTPQELVEILQSAGAIKADIDQ